MTKENKKLEKELGKELKRLKKMLAKLAEGKKYEWTTDIIDEYFENDEHDIVLLLEDYLAPILERTGAEKRENLGKFLFAVPVSEFSEFDYEYLQSEYGWEILQLLSKLSAYEVKKLGALLVFMADEWMFANKLYDELKHYV